MKCHNRATAEKLARTLGHIAVYRLGFWWVMRPEYLAAIQETEAA